MEKNAFLLYNDIVSSLYACKCEDDLRTQFLKRLNSLIPYSYASIFLADTEKGRDENGILALKPALCVPDSFAEAENGWLDIQSEDYLSWLTMSSESILVRESEVLSDEQRLNSFLYKNCYGQYNIYDTLQYAIASEKQCLGIVTLFRTRIDDSFTNDDAFYLRSLGVHLSAVFRRFTFPGSGMRRLSNEKIEDIRQGCSLTSREIEVYTMLISFADNAAICEALGIRENTLQKHLQNLFRKLGVSSRWEAAARYYVTDTPF